MGGIVKFDNVEEKVMEIRGEKVILDSELARLYDVETKRINEAVKNNPDKFPEGYLLELTKDEWTALKSKYSTSNRGGKVKLPTAFTEKGLYMLATILKSRRAVQTTLAIIDRASESAMDNIAPLCCAPEGGGFRCLIRMYV